MRMFAERGYEGVSVRDVTRALELTLGAIYHHLPSKKELYDTLVVEAFEQVMQQFVIPAAGADPAPAEFIAGAPAQKLRPIRARHIARLRAGHVI